MLAAAAASARGREQNQNAVVPTIYAAESDSLAGTHNLLGVICICGGARMLLWL